MKAGQVAFAALALALMSAFSVEKSVATGTNSALPVEASRTQTIHILQRTSKVPKIAIAFVRDPFFGPERAPVVISEPVEGKSATTAPVAPPFPGFQIIGKQQDDDGWSVFIGESGKQGQVWVVREGESFNDHFHVSKLSPPALIIRDNRSRKSKKFDIGKEEE
jgi:hypothetical protein